LIWHDRYGPLVGHQKVPLMREMVHERWARASWWLINGGLVAVIGSVLLSPWLWVVQAACLVLACGLLLATLNVFGVVFYRRDAAKTSEA